jgi:uncharacterized protein YbdZ (MbtH family)
MYRSGDVVRWTGAGELEFLGRVDDQVKVSGFRIEPAEIEAVLDRCDGVRDSTVVAVGEGEARRLVAFVVGDEGPSLSPRELRDRLAAELPAHMLPSQYAFLNDLPLRPYGKVDRHALRALTGDGAGPSSPIDALDDEAAYCVVVNEEDQYSIWPARRDVPSGWSSVGGPDSPESCLAGIEELWTDMRPRSLRAGAGRTVTASSSGT